MPMLGRKGCILLCDVKKTQYAVKIQINHCKRRMKYPKISVVNMTEPGRKAGPYAGYFSILGKVIKWHFCPYLIIYHTQSTMDANYLSLCACERYLPGKTKEQGLAGMVNDSS